MKKETNQKDKNVELYDLKGQLYFFLGHLFLSPVFKFNIYPIYKTDLSVLNLIPRLNSRDISLTIQKTSVVLMLSHLQ